VFLLQEHVIMLPYIVQGVLEDATYLQPPTHPGGCPLRWMARGGKHLYVSDEERQQLAAGVQVRKSAATQMQVCSMHLALAWQMTAG
jgi:hypothetical protein